jgi:hypothetical protein
MSGLCRSGRLTKVTRELVKYKLDLVGAEEVRRDKGTEQCIFFYVKVNKNHD